MPMAINPQQREGLLKEAQQARHNAYAPYSKYKVGAALLTESGKVYTGVNVENAAYPLSICAERTAVFKAVSDGESKFSALAVVTKNGGSPCGSCRQVMAEFAPDMDVIIAAEDGRIDLETTVADLLPYYFSPEDLP
jgi:cytidine deaminase